MAAKGHIILEISTINDPYRENSETKVITSLTKNKRTLDAR